MSSTVMNRRSTMEETMLLPLPLKLAVILLTFIVDLLRNLPLELAIGIVVGTFGLILLLFAWYFSSAKLRVVGFGLVILGCLSPVVLAPSKLSLPAVPKFEKSNPPLFPATMRVTRDNIVATSDDGWFREKNSPNRIILLRGINFGASSKIPSSEDATHLKPDDFYSKNREVSFVGRPCPLDQADEHFARLASWGFNTLRLLITWEAVEHQGPGIYDYAYIRYIRDLCRKAAKYGLSVFIDPHQDVWSRYTGGDGAPGWTLEKVGFKLGPELFETGAALTHQEFGDPFPRMAWPTNYAKLATATMFTLFFAGNDFAPKTRIDGMSAQDFLQGHYIRAMQEIMRALKEEPNVIGFDTLNEPSNGYVGLDDLRKSPYPIPQGYHMTGFEGMLIGAGFSRRIDLFSLPFIFNHTVLMNPDKKTVWQSPELDVWRQNGVWEIGPDGQPKLLRPHHFKTPKGFDFIKEYMTPFFIKVGEAVRKEIPDLIVFAEPHIDPRQPVHQHAPAKQLRDSIDGSLGWAPHFYDASTLVLKTYRSWFTLDLEREMIVLGSYFARNVFKRAALGIRKGGQGLPVLVGETGVPMDMAGSFKSRDFSQQTSAMNRVLTGLEGQFLSWTLWTYTPDNTNARGDLWNGEDLALWSRDQVTDESDLNSGGRALEAAIRPYAMRIAGIPLETSFDALDGRKRFQLKVRLVVNGNNNNEPFETVLFLPKLQYPKGIDWRVGGQGTSHLRLLSTPEEQTYVWRHDVSSESQTGGKGNLVTMDQWIEIEAQT